MGGLSIQPLLSGAVSISGASNGSGERGGTDGESGSGNGDGNSGTLSSALKTRVACGNRNK